MENNDKERTIIREAALLVIDENTIAFSKDVSERTGIAVNRIGNYLGKNYERWNLKRSYVELKKQTPMIAYFRNEDDKVQRAIENVKNRLMLERLKREKALSEKYAKRRAERETDFIGSLHKNVNDMMEKLHTEGPFNFTSLMDSTRKEFGKARTKQFTPEILDAFEQATDSKTGKYKFKDGYVY